MFFHVHVYDPMATWSFDALLKCPQHSVQLSYLSCSSLKGKRTTRSIQWAYLISLWNFYYSYYLKAQWLWWHAKMKLICQSLHNQKRTKKSTRLCLRVLSTGAISMFSVSSKHSTFVGSQGSKQALEFLYSLLLCSYPIIQKNFGGWRDVNHACMRSQVQIPISHIKARDSYPCL